MKTEPSAADHLYASNLLKQWENRLGSRGGRKPDTLEDERREVLDSIFESLRWGTGDAEARAACRTLLRHLTVGPSPC